MLRANCFAVLLSTAMICSAVAEEFLFQKVFGPDTPGGLYKHPAALEALGNGELFLAYYGGEGEYQGDTKVFGATWSPNTERWTQPRVIADTPFVSEGNPVVWRDPQDRLWLFYVCRYGETWSSSRIKYKLSTDGGQTWSDAGLLTFEAGTMVRNRPLALADGGYLLPIYIETGEDREFSAADTCSAFWRFDPQNNQWRELGRIRSRKGNLQPAVVELEPGHLLAMCRRAGGYGPNDQGYIIRAESRDSGLSWTEGVDTEFPNPNAAVDLIKLSDGRIALIYNHSMNERTPLSLAISSDGGQTFAARQDLIQGPGDFGYPYAALTNEGKALLVFTSDERTVINLGEITALRVSKGR